MDLNQLRSFIAVTQTLNFTSAARQNGVPQSTVSRQINDLEEQLKVRLFYRTKRDVQLTEEGRTFLPYALEILEASKLGAQAVRQLHSGTTGRLSIATISTSGEFLAGCLRSFHEKYPDIIVDLTCVSGAAALMDEGRDLFDFHFILQDMLPKGDEFDSLVTHKEQLCLVAPIGAELTPEELVNQRLILVTESKFPALRKQIQHYLKTQKLSCTVSNQLDDIHAILLCVSAGLGVSILPASQPAAFLHDSLEIYPLESEITYAVAWKRSLLNPAARLFLENMQEQLKRL